MRLTEKVENYIEPYERRKDIGLWDIFTKLGQLEDIEEELGIDLITLFNALRNGVYYRMSSGQITKDYVFLFSNNMNIGQVSKLDYSFMTCFEKHTLLFADYGKTWGLTKEELEK